MAPNLLSIWPRTPFPIIDSRALHLRTSEPMRSASGVPNEIQGVASIRATELPDGVSTDGGTTWADARLDAELGKYSWPMAGGLDARKRGLYRLMARAAIRSERLRARSSEPQWFMWNVIERVDVEWSKQPMARNRRTVVLSMGLAAFVVGCGQRSTTSGEATHAWPWTLHQSEVHNLRTLSTIALPHDEPLLPPGPGQRSSCSLRRLPFPAIHHHAAAVHSLGLAW